jgi:uncharacterized DUF497 family protein
VNSLPQGLDVDNVYTSLDNLYVILWDETKDAKLRKERGVSFEDVVERIVSSEVLDVLEHHTRRNQKIFVIALKGRIHAVPFLSDADGNIVLKTIYPSRKLERRYGKRQNQRQA